MDLSEKGSPENPPSDTKMQPWYSHKKIAWAESRLVVGHWSTAGAQQITTSGGSVSMLDSGCVWGGCLTALQLDGEPTATPAFIQIKC